MPSLKLAFLAFCSLLLANSALAGPRGGVRPDNRLIIIGNPPDLHGGKPASGLIIVGNPDDELVGAKLASGLIIIGNPPDIRGTRLGSRGAGTRGR